MREIKFRAWDFGNKRMVLGEAIGFTFITNTVFQDGDISATGEILLTEKVKLSELMQYTGLKDKNGKEIYEGDICHQTNHGNPYLSAVVFNAPNFEFDDGSRLTTFIEDVEIIGNIYEHSHLLNTTESGKISE